MSARVSTILTNGKAVIAALLPTWHELKYVYDVSKNSTRDARLGYAFIPLDGVTPDSQVNGSYTMDHRFEVIITDIIVRGKSDSEIQTSISSLMDTADNIFKDLVNTKVGAPTIVLNVFSPSISAPEILEAKDLLVIRLQVTIKYRSLLT